MVADLFSVSKICVSPVRFRSPVYRRVLNDLAAQPERLRTISRGDKLGSWIVIHPQRSDRFPQADDNALVLFGDLEGTRVLLVSDLGRPGQNAVLERWPELRADIVVTGLPAQNEALTDAFLDRVQPRIVIVADSEYPVWERASQKFC